MDIAKYNWDAGTEFLARLQKSATSSRQALALTTGTTLATLLALIWAINDYRAYLSLGPGGPPYNIYGWALINLLVRPFTIREKDKFSTADYPSTGAHQEVLDLPVRKGEHATARGIAPHRQKTQFAPEGMREKTWAVFEGIVAAYPQLLEMRQSLYERLHKGVFLTETHLTKSSSILPPTAVLSRGEICHMHGDMSVHLYVSPSDAKIAIERGWAERHRLARPNGAFFGRWRPFRIGQTYLMFYAPRDDEELEVLKVLVVNGVRFMSGREDIVLED